MSKIVISTFANSDLAEEAINKLSSRGLDPKTMSIVMKDVEEGKELAKNTGADVASGAASGALTGAAVGAAAGLLIGLGTIAIPGIGGLLIGGPIASALGLTGAAATTASGAITGAGIGGIIGALTSLGLPKEDAEIYESEVKNGATLVMVPIDKGDETEAKSFLSNLGADNVRVVSADANNSSFSGITPSKMQMDDKVSENRVKFGRRADDSAM